MQKQLCVDVMYPHIYQGLSKTAKSAGLAGSAPCNTSSSVGWVRS
jgi:hypothetical protein